MKHCGVVAVRACDAIHHNNNTNNNYNHNNSNNNNNNNNNNNDNNIYIQYIYYTPIWKLMFFLNPCRWRWGEVLAFLHHLPRSTGYTPHGGSLSFVLGELCYCLILFDATLQPFTCTQSSDASGAGC